MCVARVIARTPDPFWVRLRDPLVVTKTLALKSITVLGLCCIQRGVFALRWFLLVPV